MSEKDEYTIPPEGFIEFRSSHPALMGRVKLRDGRPHLALIQNGAAWVDVESIPQVISLLKQMADYVGKASGRPNLWKEVVSSSKTSPRAEPVKTRIPPQAWTKASQSVSDAQEFLNTYRSVMTAEELRVAENILDNATKAAVNLVSPGSLIAVNWDEVTRYSSQELYAFLRRNSERISESEVKELKRLIAVRLDYEKKLKDGNKVGTSSDKA